MKQQRRITSAFVIAFTYTFSISFFLMLAKYSNENDKDGDEYTPPEAMSQDEIVDSIAEEIEPNNEPDVEAEVDNNPELSPETNDVSDDEEELESDVTDASDSDGDLVDDGADEYDDDADDDEELPEAEEDEAENESSNVMFSAHIDGISANNTPNSESLLESNEDNEGEIIDDGNNEDDNDDDDDVISFTDDEDDDNIDDYGDTTDTFTIDNDEGIPLGDAENLSVEDEMPSGERGNVEVSIEDGEWMQDESDLPDSDLGSELQLQFSSLSKIDTDDTLFDFNFTDAGDENDDGEMEDLESDDAVNMLDDLDSAFLVDDEFSDSNSRF